MSKASKDDTGEVRTELPEWTDSREMLDAVGEMSEIAADVIGHESGIICMRTGEVFTATLCTKKPGVEEFHPFTGSTWRLAMARALSRAYSLRTP